MFSRLVGCASACLVALSTTAAAADAIDSATIIVTAQTSADETRRRANATPGGTDVVSHADYADRSIVSLRDALAFSPGVYLQPRYGQEVRISIRGSGLSRGFHMRGLTLLQDGVPINLADDNGDFQELEPIFFDHLEVYRGANALRFGSGTLGGAINAVTPNGRDADGFYMRLDTGSFETLRGLVSYGLASDRGDGWLAVSADTSDGDRQHQRRDSVRVHGNIGLRLTDAIETRLYASTNLIDQELPGALNLATVLSRPSTGNFVGDQARDINSVRVQNKTTFARGAWRIEIGAYLNAKELYHPIFQIVDQGSTDYGLFGRAAYEGGSVSFTLGGESRWGDVAAKRFVNVSGRRGTLTFNADQDARTSTLYGELRVHPVERLSLIAGAVYADGYRRQRQLFNSFAGGATDVIGKASYSEFSPKFGLLYDAAETIQLFGNYSRSAELPGFIELAQIAAFAPLDAQRAWTFEIGTRGSIGPIAWDIAAYRADLDGELLQFNVGPDIPVSTFNAGRTRHQGIEAGVDITVLPQLRLRQTFMLSDFRFRGDVQYGNNRLPVVPKHVYRAELRIGTDAVHVTPNIEWLPQGAFADYRNTLRTRGYALLGFSAGARLFDRVDLFFDARNLTAKKAVGDISAVIAATPASVIYFPVERRAIYGGVRARF
jgi:iron complex outermembrane receptor protein